MKKIKYRYLIANAGILFLFILFSGFSASNPAIKATSGGELSFTVRTVTANGNFSPRHVLAIWIEDLNGFVKSRKVMANQRKQYLYTWVSSSNYNVVDAITGATLNSHQTHTVTWDCTDLNGEIVPDGDYVVWAEFTEQHAQGPLFSATFTKGPDTQVLTPPDETYFKDIVITFTPVVAEFSANTTEVCQSGAVIFTDESVNATSWEWDFGEDAVPATATTQGPHTVHYAYPGTNTVSLTVNNSITETKSDYINVLNAPIADFMYSGSDMTVNFVNTSINALTYMWDFGDGNTSNVQNPSHVYATAGTYQVSLIAYYEDCNDEIMQEVAVPLVGLDELTEDEIFSVYPNPNTGRFYIELDQKSVVKEIRIIDLSGKLIRSFSASSFDNRIPVNMEDADKGIYLIEIITDKAVYSRKVLIE